MTHAEKRKLKLDLYKNLRGTEKSVRFKNLTQLWKSGRVQASYGSEESIYWPEKAAERLRWAKDRGLI